MWTSIKIPHGKKWKSWRRNTAGEQVMFCFLNRARKEVRIAALKALWIGASVRWENMDRRLAGRMGAALRTSSPKDLLAPAMDLDVPTSERSTGGNPSVRRKSVRADT